MSLHRSAIVLNTDMTRILVTGSSGFIGSHLVDRLITEGFEVRLFDAKPYPYPHPEGSVFESIIGNLSSLTQIEEAVKDCAGIVHLAAVSRVSLGHQYPLDCIATNVMGTVNLLEAARRPLIPPWIVMASSAGGTEHPCPGRNFEHLYGISKYSAEQCAVRYSEDYGVKVLTLRFSDIYGSERDHSAKVLPLFLEKARSSEPLVVLNPGMRFDLTFYEDAITAIISSTAYLETQAGGIYESLQICTGHEVTLLELAETIVDVTGSSSVIEILDCHRFVQEGRISFDPFPAREVLGFEARVSLREGIRNLHTTTAG